VYLCHLSATVCRSVGLSLVSRLSSLVSRLSSLVSRLSSLVSRLSRLSLSHPPPSPLTSHLSPLTSHLSPLTSHLSPLTSHPTPLSLSNTLLADAQEMNPAFRRSRDGLWLFTHRWMIPNPKAIVFIVHGLGEHILRYEHVARFLNRRGYAVFGMDHQGHGQSDGDRAYATGLQSMVGDYLDFVKHEIDNWGKPDTAHEIDADTEQTSDDNKQRMPPMLLLGHSMGGLLAAHIALQSHDIKWDGIVFSAPAFAIGDKIGAGTIAMAKLLAAYLPKLRLDKVGATEVSRHPVTIDRYQRDPIVAQEAVQVGMGNALLSGMQGLDEKIVHITAPSMLMLGQSDIIVSVEGAKRVYSHIGSKNTKIIEYEHARHEVFNELREVRVKALHDLAQFFDSTVDK
jgi:acylglycerol lipase